MKKYLYALACFPATACAGLQFNPDPQGDAFTYFEPQPFLSVVVNSECEYTASAVSLPGRPRSVSFRQGLGSAKVSIAIGAAGMLTNVNSETSGVVDDVVGLLGALSPIVGLDATGSPATCTSGAVLFPIIYEDGTGRVTIDTANPVDITIPRQR